eukprot:TRINITY_DN7392_c0_g2_i1.p1 TRINITY_DN7392_c0_g2~~TRINITY_DN7392_c0_g2_i1.p1  ORF type:complete len:417 (-),score=76.20 TRINITY_DN7392_c0_g2_i1:319-1569(-)
MKSDFRFEHVLGKGSYGAVYKVLRKSDKNYYALKEVNIKSLSQREREDAVNEIRLLASLSHPNIIKYYEAFTHRDNLYICMEFAKYGDLHRLIQKQRSKNKHLPEAVVWNLFIQMCKGLQCLHKKRIVHRDLKPKNIFMMSSDKLTIGDLGCSKVMKQDLTRTQVGTPYYMSPEIWGKHAYDEKNDIWALGCIIFEMCALRPPFLANDMPSLARQVKVATVPRIPSSYSSGLGRVVASMLVKNPAKRANIDSILASPEVVAHMTSTVPCTPVVKRNPPRILSTIKVPRRLEHGLKLPASQYPGSPARRMPESSDEAKHSSRSRSMSSNTSRQTHGHRRQSSRAPSSKSEAKRDVRLPNVPRSRDGRPGIPTGRSDARPRLNQIYGNAGIKQPQTRANRHQVPPRYPARPRGMNRLY